MYSTMGVFVTAHVACPTLPRRVWTVKVVAIACVGFVSGVIVA